MTDNKIQIHVFGKIEILVNNEAIKISSEISRLIIPILIIGGGTVSKEKLAGMFWPDSPIPKSRHNLRQAIYRLKQELANGGINPEILNSDRADLQLIWNHEWECDLVQFKNIADTVAKHNHKEQEVCPTCANNLENLSKIYQGELFSDIFADSDILTDWLASQRTGYHSRAWSLFLKLIDHYFYTINFEKASLLSEALIHKFQDYHDTLFYRWFWALYANGQKNEAIKIYQDYYLKKGICPDEQITQMIDEIKQSPLIKSHNLRHEEFFFTGRESEQAVILDQIQKKARRLISIISDAGSGKTTLAEHLGKKILGSLFMPVYMINIPEGNAQFSALIHLAQTLFITLKNDFPIEKQILSRLESLRMVLILDACEHQLEASEALINGVLSHCPGIVIIATSRIRLNLNLGTSYSLGLSNFSFNQHFLQDEINILPFTQLEANRLFIHVLDKQVSNYIVTNETAPIIADFCHKLGGIPLAIELVAAQIPKRGFEIVHESLGRYISTAGEWSFPQILTNTMNWVNSILSSDDVHTMQCLSIFATAVSLEAASVFTNCPESECKFILDRLAQQNLLKYDQHSKRYLIHDFVKQFFYEKISANTEKSLTSSYIRYYQTLIHDLGTKINSAEFEIIVQNLKFEKSNIEKAVNLALQTQNFDIASLLLADLTPFYLLTGDIWNIKTLVDRALKSPGSPKTLLSVLFSRGNISNALGELDEAQSYFEQAKLLAESIQDKNTTINIRRALAVIYARKNQYELAEQEFSFIITDARETQNKSVLANGLMNLANVLISRGVHDFTYIENLINESIDLLAESNEWVRVSAALNNLGIVLRKQGKIKESINTYQRSLQIKQKTGDSLGMASTLTNLGLVQAQAKDYSSSFQTFYQAIDLLIKLNLPHGVPGILGNLARAMMLSKDWHNATIIFGSSERVYSDIGKKSVFDSTERKEWLSDLQENISDPEFSHLFDFGYGKQGIDALTNAIQILAIPRPSGELELPGT